MNWQERLLAERSELEERLGKLKAFLADEQVLNLPIADIELLLRQRRHMNRYLQVLELRCERIKSMLAR